MEATILLRITITKPNTDTDFGLQKGSGNAYEIIAKQHSVGEDVSFNFEIKITGDRDKDTLPKLSGPFVQGPAGGKFVYVNIGTYAGQLNSIWAGRMKVPLTNVTWNMADALLANPKLILATTVPGTKPNGSPNYATVKPFEGWKVV